MAGRVRYLKEKGGRYYARISVPQRLRPFLEKPASELLEPLGADRKTALRLLPAAVVRLQNQVDAASRRASANEGTPPAPLYTYTREQLAAQHYSERLAVDEELRNNHIYASVGVNDLYVEMLRACMAGKLSDKELNEVIGSQVERFRKKGMLSAATGTNEWRHIARSLCAAEYEFLARMVERDDGNFEGVTTNPALAMPIPTEELPEPVNLSKLWVDYLNTRKDAGFIRDGGRRQEPVIRSLKEFLKHNDARRVTRKNLLEWRDNLLNERKLSPKTINDIYLSTIRSLFSWAHENELIPENVAVNVRQPKPRKAQSRERGYTDAEALVVLRASRSHVPKPNQVGYVRETAHMTSAIRWAPILCAFSGARIAEITQLRKQDFRTVEKRWIMRITPDAGSVKTGDWRDVPLHQQIVEEGFATFLADAAEGPLFHGASDPEQYATAASSVADAIAKWLRRSEITPDGIQPNHAWRHRLKTVGRELGLSDRVIDAIQGHAGRTAGDNYGDVTLTAKIRAIDAFPRFDLK